MMIYMLVTEKISKKSTKNIHGNVNNFLPNIIFLGNL